ncbi:hypothetical protein BDR04DRAFT_1096572, partial [Suillus decipiens]
ATTHQPKILTDNFEGLKRVDNKSRRKFWNCNYCTSTSGITAVSYILQTPKSARMLHHLSAMKLAESYCEQVLPLT